jgi:hypothetical protein
MEKRTKLFIAALVGATALGVGAGVGLADVVDVDRPLKGTDYERATAAALGHVGKGTVTDTEIGDFGRGYEVEIRVDDSTQVEVHLTRDFGVTGQEVDDDGPNDRDTGGDDD